MQYFFTIYTHLKKITYIVLKRGDIFSCQDQFKLLTFFNCGNLFSTVLTFSKSRFCYYLIKLFFLEHIHLKYKYNKKYSSDGSMSSAWQQANPRCTRGRRRGSERALLLRWAGPCTDSLEAMLPSVSRQARHYACPPDFARKKKKKISWPDSTFMPPLKMTVP